MRAIPQFPIVQFGSDCRLTFRGPFCRFGCEVSRDAENQKLRRVPSNKTKMCSAGARTIFFVFAWPSAWALCPRNWAVESGGKVTRFITCRDRDKSALHSGASLYDFTQGPAPRFILVWVNGSDRSLVAFTCKLKDPRYSACRAGYIIQTRLDESLAKLLLVDCMCL